MAPCVWTASVKKPLYSSHSDIPLLSNNRKVSHPSLCRCPPSGFQRDAWRGRFFRASKARYLNQSFSTYIDTMPNSSSPKRRSLSAMCCWSELRASFSQWIRSPKSTNDVNVSPPADIEYRKGPPHCRHRSYHFGKSRYKSNVLRLCLPSSILFFQERDFQNPGKVLLWRGLQTPVFYQKFDVQKTCALVCTPIKISSAESDSTFLEQTSSAIFPKFERTA